MIGLPLFCGLALSLAAIPYYQWTLSPCFINFFPFRENQAKLFGFLILPISSCIVILSFLMIRIYLSVREKSMKSSKYLFSDSSSRSVQVRVLWQSLSYLAAFMTTWPIIMVGTLLASMNGELPYWFTTVIIALAPIQGFVNALVYFQPRISLFLYEWTHPIQKGGVAQTSMWENSKATEGDAKPHTIHIDPRLAVADDSSHMLKQEPKITEESLLEQATTSQDEKSEEGEDSFEPPEDGMDLEDDSENERDSVVLSDVEPTHDGLNISGRLKDDALNDIADRLVQGSQFTTDQLERIKRRILHLQMDPSLVIAGDLEEQVLESMDGGDFDSQASHSQLSLGKLGDAIAALIHGPRGQDRSRTRTGRLEAHEEAHEES